MGEPCGMQFNLTVANQVHPPPILSTRCCLLYFQQLNSRHSVLLSCNFFPQIFDLIQEISINLKLTWEKKVYFSSRGSNPLSYSSQSLLYFMQ